MPSYSIENFLKKDLSDLYFHLLLDFSFKIVAKLFIKPDSNLK